MIGDIINIFSSFSETERWVIGLIVLVGGGIIAQWIGQRISHGLSISREKRSILRSAVNTYKSAFDTEIAALSNDEIGLDVFAKAFDRHKDAVDSIRPILPEGYQRKLQKAWDEYRGKDNDLGFEEEEFVQAWSATLFHGGREYFREFIKRFQNLHTCLDCLL